MAIPNGDITLLRDVPLSASYEHTIDFKNKDEQFTYFFNFRKHTLIEYSYIRKEREYIAVELPLSALDNVNYLTFRSSEEDRRYYAFVTDKVYVNPTTSHVFYTIDVLQTYMFDYKWRASYIAQGHVDRWTADHKPIYSKTEEDLAYGTEYAVENGYRIDQDQPIQWLLVALKNYTELIESGSKVVNTNVFPVASPYSFMLVPIVNEKESAYRGKSFVRATYTNWAGNTESDIIGGWEHFVNKMLKHGLGDYVHSVSLLPYVPFMQYVSSPTYEVVSFGIVDNVEGKVYDVTLSDVSNFGAVELSGGSVDKFLVLKSYGFDTEKLRTLAIADWDIGLSGSMPTAKQWEEIKANPRTTKRDKRFESKLLCYPYRFNLLTDWRSDPVVLKNEYMTTDKIEIMYNFAFSNNAPFRYWVKNYKKDPEGRNTCLSQPIALEFPIISDQYYSYMLQNKNTIQANLTNSIINASAGTINGIISGAGVGGVGGAVYGGITGAIGGALNVSAQIRSENAKQQDLRAKPDVVINSVESAFNVIDNNTGVNFYRMRVCCENEEILAEIFNMSGYKVNRVEVPNTRSRVRFNYIQTVGANIVGSFNQNDLLKIKAIYDKGVTIWHYSEKDFNPLDYSYENIEVILL